MTESRISFLTVFYTQPKSGQRRLWLKRWRLHSACWTNALSELFDKHSVFAHVQTPLQFRIPVPLSIQTGIVFEFGTVMQNNKLFISVIILGIIYIIFIPYLLYLICPDRNLFQYFEWIRTNFLILGLWPIKYIPGCFSNTRKGRLLDLPLAIILPSCRFYWLHWPDRSPRHPANQPCT
jgi:hypothetical protein